ncbi:MAG: translocation/assembly module TamB [Deltaproteobacteria bacterium]|nr:translocation/assembly module TamB [Deltaproteobacteria bacterium]
MGKRAVKIGLWAAALLACAALVFALAATLYLRSDSGARAMLRAANRALSSRGLRVSWTRIGLSGVNSVWAENVIISDPSGILFKARKASFGPVIPLLMGKNPPLDLSLVGPSLALSRNGEGQWNISAALARLKAVGKKKKKEKNLLVMERISVKDGLVHLSIPGFSDEIGVNAKASLKGGILDVKRLVLSDKSLKARISGNLALTKDASSDLTVRAEAGALTPYKALWPGLPGLSGLQITARVKGAARALTADFSASVFPGQEVSGTLSLARGTGAARAGWDLRFENLSASAFYPSFPALLNGKARGDFRKISGKAEFSASLDLSPSTVHGLSINAAKISATRKKGADALSVSASTAAGGLGLTVKGYSAGLFSKKGPVNLNFAARLSKADPKALLAALGIGKGGVEAGNVNADISGSLKKKAGGGLKDAVWAARVKAGPSGYGKFKVAGASFHAKGSPGRLDVSAGRVKAKDADLGFSYAGDFAGNGRAKVSGRVDDLAGILSLFGAKGLSGRALVDLSATLAENARKLEISGKAHGTGVSWRSETLAAGAGNAAFGGRVKIFFRPDRAFSGLRADGGLTAKNLSGRTIGKGGRGVPFSSSLLETDGNFQLAPDSAGKLRSALSLTYSARSPKVFKTVAKAAAGRFSADFGKRTANLKLAATGLSVSGRRADKLELSADAQNGAAVFDLAVKDFESADLAASGRVGRAGADGARTVSLSRLVFSAQATTYAATGPSVFYLSSRGVSVSRLDIASKDQFFSIAGLYEWKGRRDIAVAGRNLALAPIFRLVSPKVSVTGKADFSATLTGTAKKPRLVAEAVARGLSAGRVSFKRAQASGIWDGAAAFATALLDPATGGSITLSARAPLVVDSKMDLLSQARRVILDVSGRDLDTASLAALFWDDAGLSGKLDLNASLSGSGPDKKAVGNAVLRNARLEGYPEIARAEAKFGYSRHSASVSGLLRPSKGGQVSFSGQMPLDPERLPSKNSLKKTRIRARLAARDIPLSLGASRVKALVGARGSLGVDAFFSGTPANPDITGKLRLSNASPADGRASCNAEAVWGFCDGRATISGVVRPDRGGSLAARALLVLDPNGELSVASFKKGRLSARFSARGFDLTLPASFIKAVSEVHGSLDADALATGQLMKPAVSGTALVKAKSLTLNGLGKPLTDVGAELSFKDNVLSVKKFSARSPGLGGWISGYGTVGFSERLSPLGLDFFVKGDKLDLAHSGYVNASASGKIRVGGTAKAPVITGAVSVGEGLLRLDKYLAIRRPETVKETDVSFVGENEPARPPLPGAWKAAAVDLSIKVDGPFWVRGAGAQLQVEGLLGWKKPKGRDHAAVSGHLDTVRGVYELSGKTFTLKRGRADFPGIYPADPILDVLAEYTVKEVVVRLNVTGRLSAMNLALSSEPSMDEAEVASYLLFGKKIGSLTPGQAGSLAEKGAAMLGNQVLAQLRREFGPMIPVDMISVDGGENGDSSTLVVGKHITPDIFVTWRRATAGQSSDQVTVEYRVSPNVVIESQVGEEDSGVDIFYTFEY